MKAKRGAYGQLRFAEAESRTVEGQAPSSSEEEEELTEEQLEEKRQVERLRMEAFIRASRLSSQQTPDDQTFMPRKPNQKRERERTKIAYMYEWR